MKVWQKAYITAKSAGEARRVHRGVSELHRRDAKRAEKCDL